MSLLLTRSVYTLYHSHSKFEQKKKLKCNMNLCIIGQINSQLENPSSLFQPTLHYQLQVVLGHQEVLSNFIQQFAEYRWRTLLGHNVILVISFFLIQSIRYCFAYIDLLLTIHQLRSRPDTDQNTRIRIHNPVFKGTWQTPGGKFVNYIVLKDSIEAKVDISR